MKQCNACLGIYAPVGADGVTYYHVCPPVTRVPVLRAGVKALVDLADLQQADVVVARRGDARVQVQVADLLPGDTRLGDVHVTRADHRDETVVATLVGDKVVGVAKHEGVGAREIVVVPPDPHDVFKAAAPP